MATAPSVTSRQVAVDLMSIMAIAVLLVTVHLLVPFGFRDQLALWYAAPDPLAALTAAYVHADEAHLTGNVIGYLAGATVAYGMSLAAGERLWFQLSWVSCLTVLPIAVGLTSAAVIARPVVARGFSGVVAGFVGLVIVSAGVVVYRRTGINRAAMWEVVMFVATVAAAEILWLGTDASPTVVFGIAMIGTLLPLGSLVWRGRQSGWPDRRDEWIQLGGAIAVTGLVIGVITWFVMGLFPPRIVGPTGVTNVLAHYLGIVYGGAIAAWGYRYWSVHPSNRGS